MCNYCYFEPNGDIPDTYEYILSEPINLNILIDDSPAATADVKTKIQMDASVWHDQNKDEWLLNVSLFDNFDPPLLIGETPGGIFIEGKINFCPMCGRKL